MQAAQKQHHTDGEEWLPDVNSWNFSLIERWGMGTQSESGRTHGCRLLNVLSLSAHPRNQQRLLRFWPVPPGHKWMEPSLGGIYLPWFCLSDLSHQAKSVRCGGFPYCWHKTRTGCYSVKSGYYALREESDRTQMQQPHITSFDWRKFIWHEETSPKLQLFLWKMARGALPLGDNLQHRDIPVPGLCPHCLEPETAIHLFFHCPLARQVWDLAPLRLPPDFLSSATLSNAFTMMSSLVCLLPTGISNSLSSWILWGLWTVWNLLIFKNRGLTTKAIIGGAMSSAIEWRGA